jgi:guanylate kinase
MASMIQMVFMVSKNKLIQRRGLMLVFSSTSGAGKTTIAHQLFESDKDVTLSISATTRPKRPGEVDGQDYYFMTEKNFQGIAQGKGFLESAKVFGHHYGTPKAPVEVALGNGKDMLFDIDWRGTQQLSHAARNDLVSIFILPPSWKALEERLYKRGQDSSSEISKRMTKAADEMSHWEEYDYIIINDDLKQSVTEARAILDSERLKRKRQLGLADFVRQLQAH